MEDLVKNSFPLAPERSINIGYLLSVLDYWFLHPTKRVPESGKNYLFKLLHAPPPICSPCTGVFSSLGILAPFQLKVPDFLATFEDVMIQAGQQCETKTTDPSEIINPTFSLQVCFKVLSLPCPCPSPTRPFVHLAIKEDKSGNSLMGVL